MTLGRLIAVGSIALAITTTLVVAPTPPGGGHAAVAADAGAFNPGMLISDAQFYDSNAMSVGAVQQFLNSRVGTCRSGYVCLKDLRMDHQAEAADRNCAFIPGGNHSSAEIIDLVSRACGISQRVILVLLEKEQGLVSDTWPLASQYRSATGYGCPDTAACDSRYYGLFNQVFMAAWQFKQYAARPGSYSHRAGALNDVRYSPSAACGTRPVFIENQATASLYNYTPYTPNQAALNNMYGVGDGCSAYGNRNFWRMYSDWFGDPGIGVHGAIRATWLSGGGAGGSLGSPVAGETCRWGEPVECTQDFRGGTIVWTPTRGAHSIAGAIREVWRASSSTIGAPVAAESCTWTGDVHCLQHFASGSVVWRPTTGAHYAAGGIANLWWASRGTIGDAVADEVCAWSGEVNCAQEFQRGTIIWTPGTGMHYVAGAIRETWRASRGTIGVPIGPETCFWSGDVRCAQDFQAGTIVWRPSTGSNYVAGGIRETWRSAEGIIGGPVSAEACVWSGDVGCVQDFQRGSVVWTPASGTYFVAGAIREAWRAGRSVIGAPSGSERCSWSGDVKCEQEFQSGTVVWRPATGAHYTAGGIRQTWLASRTIIGDPIGGEICNWTGDVGCTQEFEAGTISWTPTTGTWFVAGAIRNAWRSNLAVVGAPSAGESCTWTGDVRCTQDFERARITWRPASGAVIGSR